MSKYDSMSARELRDEAKKLGVSGYSSMKKDELLEAVASLGGSKPAKKKRAAKESTKKATKAKATKTTKVKATKDVDPGNPFRKDTNLWFITEALKKGGTRQSLIDELKEDLEFTPRKQTKKEFDVEEEIDRRLKVVGYILRKEHSWTFEHEGRGREAVIGATPPA